MSPSAMLRCRHGAAFAKPPTRRWHTSKRHQRTVCSTSPPNLPLFYSDLYTYPLPPNHRFPMVKYELVRKQLQRDPLLRNSTFTPSPLATRRELEPAHSRDYIDRVLTRGLSKLEERAIGLPQTLAGVRRALGSTGGTVAALRAVVNGARMAGQLAGGTHHARREGGAGFCVFNDMAVAAYEALRLGMGRVALVDFDVHQGEGSAEIFGDEDRVRTVSFHAVGNYPFQKGASDVDVGFADGVADEEYLQTVAEVLPRVLRRTDVVILQMGVDGLVHDRLGRLALSREGLSRRNRMVYEHVLRNGLKAVITMGGGYADPIQLSVDAHCDVYTDAVRCLARW